MNSLRRLLQPAVTYGSYPLAFLVCLAACIHAVREGWDFASVHGRLVMGVAAFHIALELLFPMDRRWGMTWRSLLRDAAYLALNGAVQAGGRAAAGWAAIRLAPDGGGLMAGLPFWAALPLLLLTFEFLQYWHHRWSHEMGGPLGRFLWRVHAAHHLPDRVYVLMHAVGHPLNLLVVNILLMVLLPALLGCRPEVVFVFAVFSNLQGIVTHLNVDVRVGPLNYLLAGAELHRFHHSTDRSEAKNYGAVLSVYDVLFGTFVYRPGGRPAALGVAEPERYPRPHQLLRVLALPFSGLPRRSDPG